MRKVIFGFIWFLVFWYGSLMVGGMVVGGVAGAEAQNARQGHRAGQSAEEEFAKSYGGRMLLGSALAATIGAGGGLLPGARKKRPPLR